MGCIVGNCFAAAIQSPSWPNRSTDLFEMTADLFEVFVYHLLLHNLATTLRNGVLARNMRIHTARLGIGMTVWLP